MQYLVFNLSFYTSLTDKCEKLDLIDYIKEGRNLESLTFISKEKIEKSSQFLHKFQVSMTNFNTYLIYNLISKFLSGGRQ
ncbi:MAG TPA: hypothetical protein DF984_03550 [Anaerolineaceae bacterium]|nr:hypothetical protein [Anaerolineaceae bacterium]